MGKCQYSICDRKPNDLLGMAKCLITTSWKIIYEKKADIWYHVHCCECGYDAIVPYKRLKMMRDAKMCCRCGSEIKFTRKTNFPIVEYIAEENGDNIDGYLVSFTCDFGHPKDIKCVHVYHQDNTGEYVKYIYKYMCGLSFDWNRNYWRKLRKYARYIDCFHSYEYRNNLDFGKIKEKYEKFEADLNIAFKSNQKRFIIDGVYNNNQLKYIYYFDLNYPEEIERNMGYIKAHHLLLNKTIAQTIKKLNIHYLDYLRRENIDLSNYLDYADACEKLGIKAEKPKHDLFMVEHDKVIDLLEFKKNEKYSEQVEKRGKQLQKYEYSKGEYIIKPYDKLDDIINTSSKLHNCIKTYVGRYANNETNIFYCKRNDQLVMAIEVRDNRLIQCRTDFNGTPNEEEKKFIKNWCKNKQITCSL